MINYELSDNKYILFYKHANQELSSYNAMTIVTYLRKIHDIKLTDIINTSGITPTLFHTKIAFQNKEDAIKFIEVTNSIILINKLKECV